MQKVINLLEQYVEWVALAIGGLFLLLMVMFYVIGTPISARVGESKLTLANVETKMYDEAGRRLEQAMTEPGIPSAQPEHYAKQFEDFMAMKDVKQPSLATKAWLGWGAPSTPLKAEEKQPGKAAPDAIAAVPQSLPAPKWYGASSGKTYVNTDAKAAPMAMAGVGMPDGMGMPPGEDFGGPPPGFGPPAGTFGPPPGFIPPGAGAPVAPAAAPAAGAAPAGAADKVWITQAFTIPTDALAKTFADAKVPANLTTVFLRLDVIREEKLENGTWGNSTIVQPMKFHQVPDFPKEGSGIDERTYLDWASKNAQTLLAPSFYPKIAGDTWFAPGQPNPNRIDIKPVVNPGPRRTRQQDMYPDGMGGPPPGMGGPQPRNRRPRNYAAADGQRPGQPYGGPPPEAIRAMQQAAAQAAAQAQSAAAAAQAGAAGMPPGMPGMPYGEGYGGVGRVTVAVPEGYKVPSGTFNPSELGGDIFVWFHDDTVEPGKTYRYKMAYRLRNPVFGFQNLVAVPAAAKQFAIKSEMSDWGKEITAEPVTRFFVATGAAGNSVRIEVFHWQEGKWNNKVFTVTPGDIIGSTDGKIDYKTGWSLVDLQPGAKSNQHIILADARGDLQSRSYQQDLTVRPQFIKDSGWKDPNAPQPRVPGTGMPDDFGGYGGPPPGVQFGPPGGGGFVAPPTR